MENKLFIENQEELLLRQSNSPLLLDSYPRHQWKERYLSYVIIIVIWLLAFCAFSIVTLFSIYLNTRYAML